MTHTWSSNFAGHLQPTPAGVPAPAILDSDMIRLPGICMATVTQATVLPNILQDVVTLDAHDRTGGLSLAHFDTLILGAPIAPAPANRDEVIRQRDWFINTLFSAADHFTGSPGAEDRALRPWSAEPSTPKP